MNPRPMSSPLTKSDLCWVLVKLAGAYFVFAGCSGMFTAVIGWAAVSGDLEKLPISGRSSVYAPFIGMIAACLLPLGIGAYLLRSGELLYYCLMSVPFLQPAVTNDQSPAKKGRALGPGIILDDREIEAFHTWLDQHPEFQNRPLIDQIALFRDAWGMGPKT